MSAQCYNIDPRAVREAIDEIERDENAVLVVSGPTCSGKSTLCSALRECFPTLKHRICGANNTYTATDTTTTGAPADPRTVTLSTLITLDVEKTVPRDEIMGPLVADIRSIFDKSSTHHTFFNDENRK